MFSSLAAGINFSKYDDIPVELTGRDPPTAINTFEEAGLFDTLRSNVEKSHYEKPTPVQKNSIPVVLAGRDLMACAQTGSGKKVMCTCVSLYTAVVTMQKVVCANIGTVISDHPNMLFCCYVKFYGFVICMFTHIAVFIWLLVISCLPLLHVCQHWAISIDNENK